MPKQETVKAKITLHYDNAQRGREKMMEDKAQKEMKKHIRYRLRRLDPSASVVSVEQGYDGAVIDLVMYEDFDGNPRKAKSIVEGFIGEILEELAFESEYNEEKYGNLHYFLPVGSDGDVYWRDVQVEIDYVPEAFGQQRLFATQLVRLGHEKPELRKHLRPILDNLKTARDDDRLGSVLTNAVQFSSKFEEWLELTEMVAHKAKWKTEYDRLFRSLEKAHNTYSLELYQLRTAVLAGYQDVADKKGDSTIKAWSAFEKAWDKLRGSVARDQSMSAQMFLKNFKRLKYFYTELTEYGSSYVLNRLL